MVNYLSKLSLNGKIIGAVVRVYTIERGQMVRFIRAKDIKRTDHRWKEAVLLIPRTTYVKYASEVTSEFNELTDYIKNSTCGIGFKNVTKSHYGKDVVFTCDITLNSHNPTHVIFDWLQGEIESAITNSRVQDAYGYVVWDDNKNKAVLVVQIPEEIFTDGEEGINGTFRISQLHIGGDGNVIMSIVNRDGASDSGARGYVLDRTCTEKMLTKQMKFKSTNEVSLCNKVGQEQIGLLRANGIKVFRTDKNKAELKASELNSVSRYGILKGKIGITAIDRMRVYKTGMI